MKKSIFILLLLLPVCLFSQIGQQRQNNTGGITGKWINNDFGYQMSLVFNNDGTCLIDGYNYNYNVSGNTLNVSDGYENISYNYSLNAGNLILSGGDLTQSMIFTRENTNQAIQPGIKQNTASGNLIGTWQNQGETVVFTGNTMTINGVQYNYSNNGNQISIQTVNGPQAISYSINGNSLTMLINGVTYIFHKSESGTQNTGYNSYQPQQQARQYGNLPGTIDRSIVGKWYYYSSSSNYYSSGSSSSERILEIKQDGTYKYYYEGGVSATNYDQYGNEVMHGQSGREDSDSGTWRLQGNTLHVNSNTEGYQTYTLQKQNNQNNEPMIVIDGDPYVTYYKKPPW